VNLISAVLVAVLYNLQVRFCEQNYIYTYCGKLNAGFLEMFVMLFLFDLIKFLYLIIYTVCLSERCFQTVYLLLIF